MSNQLPVVVKGTHPQLGYCMTLSDKFLTLVTPNPPAGETAEILYSYGWEVYYQPVPYLWIVMSRTKDSWITTYRKIK